MKRALGRLQWATAACPLALLQPFWAWKMAVTSSGHPPNTVRLLAALLKEMLTMPYTQESPYLPKSSWWGCSDASASERGEAHIGGWISNRKNPRTRTPRSALPLLSSSARISNFDGANSSDASLFWDAQSLQVMSYENSILGRTISLIRISLALILNDNFRYPHY